MMSKVTTKLRVIPHVRGASIGSKRMRGIKVHIAGISLLKWSRGLLSLCSEPGGEGIMFG
jgi:hypothetical protein